MAGGTPGLGKALSFYFHLSKKPSEGALQLGAVRFIQELAFLS